MNARWSVIALLVLPPLLAQTADHPEGKRIFLDYQCYACHGFSGQNGPGRRLVPMGLTESTFVKYVRRPGTRAMPSYSTDVLTDRQLSDVWTYIQDLPKSPPAESIPLLQQIKAEAGK